MTRLGLYHYISICYIVINFQFSPKIGYCNLVAMLLQAVQSDQLTGLKNPFHHKE